MLLQKVIKLIVIITFIFFVGDNFAHSQCVDINAKILTTGKLTHGAELKQLYIKISLYNKMDNNIEIKPYKVMGKEQFKSATGIKMHNKDYLVLSYVDHLRLSYIDANKNIDSQHLVPFPIASIILPDNYVEAIIQIPYPSQKGKYDLKIEMEPSESEPVYNSISVGSKNKIISIDKIPSFTIKGIEIK
jgi:hypothetical protein